MFGQTSSQIREAKKIIKQTGMNEAQVRAAAKSQGFSEKQINEAIKREKSKVGNKESLLKDDLDVISNQDNSNILVDPIPNLNENLSKPQISEEENLEVIEDEIVKLESIESEERKKLNYFGYDIFKKDPALFQASSVGAVDPNYLIGPDDEIIVTMWGETQFRQVLTVNREGFIFIPEIGQVFVNGLNLNLLESKLFRVLSQSYASLDPSNRSATTFLDVSLGNLRPLRIQVLGEVAQPGAYTVNPSTTLFSSLYYFKGPTFLGSLRDVQLIRGGKVKASIDFYDYLLTGKKPNDKKLQLDDIIFIPQRLKTISIQGEINRPGIYELDSKEDLQDLISLAGGLQVTAYLDRAQIDRIVPFDQRKAFGMDRMFNDVNLNEVLNSSKSIDLQDGDRVQVFSIMDMRQNIVTIEGAVSRPGVYDLGDGLLVKELILKADSLLGDAYLDRADIVRLKPDFNEELIKIDLKKVMEEDKNDNIVLQSLDRIRVYSSSEMIPRTYASIAGHVKKPGRYILQENTTLYDLVFKSGGYMDEEFKKRTYLKRAELIRTTEDINRKEIVPFDLGLVIDKQGFAKTLLKNNDLIRIYSKSDIQGETRFVTITGHAKRPGDYELYQENMTIHDLLFRAGGFDDQLHYDNTFLERADLIRYSKSRINKKIISFKLGEILANPNHPDNIMLEPGDLIRIYSKKVFDYVRKVNISGTVENPGLYEYKKGMKLKDLILEAGG